MGASAIQRMKESAPLTRQRAKNPQRVTVAWDTPTQFKVPIPEDEPERLADLRSFKVLDTPSDERLDCLTQLASHICQTPIALISLVDTHRQWFKSKVGLDVSETSREHALCAHAILHPDLFIVTDASKDIRFADNPLVTTTPKIRFYAGAPLITPENHVLGTLCVIDRVARELTPKQAEALRALSQQVMSYLVMRRQVLEQREELLELKRENKQLARAKAAAETANRLKDELLNKIGEQTRTRLGTVQDLNEQLLEQRLTAQDRRSVRKIQSETDRLLALTHEVVNLAKVTVRRVQSERR